MKILKLAILALMLSGSVVSAFASCTHDDDRASDGSRCGHRSSDSRPGGK